MRDPVGRIPAGAAVTIISGNQYQGFGNAGNQLQDGSALFFRAEGQPDWRTVPLLFDSANGNNKYFAGVIADGFPVGAVVQYYLRIAYDDHDTTFVNAAGDFSATTDNEDVARATPFGYEVVDPADTGRWDAVTALPNVAVHTSVLPTGKVLIWGRRMVGNPDVDVRECTPFVWDPQTGEAVATTQPESLAGQTVNLFCSGHSFLPDGSLLVVGGHKTDGDGIDQASRYDPFTNIWTPGPPMNHGRWYPTAVTLPDGRALVAGGSYQETEDGGAIPNFEPQIWQDGGWVPFVGLPNGAPFPLYPRLHVTSEATVTMSGQLAQTWTLTTTGAPTWTVSEGREMKDRDYCPAVSYAPGKLIYLGGGNDADTGRPTAVVEVCDVRAPGATWQRTNPMAFPRRQHNGTLLADGTVLVTGGTRGVGFNDLGQGEPVHQAEIWNPGDGTWTTVASEQVDRCYHATAVLLHDGTVLSGGGGEFRVDGNPDNANDPADSHPTAQIYRPPYLFRGARPQLLLVPESADYGQTFDVDTDQLNQITKVNWIRLSTATHSANMGQLIATSTPQVVGGRLRVSTPAGPGDCPPGHYLLFLVNAAGVPSVGSIVQLNAVAPDVPPQPFVLHQIGPRPLAVDAGRGVARRLAAEATAAQSGTRVVVGVTGLCPYGIGACWGGAHEGLLQLDRVAHVVPVPDAEHSTATVYLADQGVPILTRWRGQFAEFVNGSYQLRGVEVTLSGRVLRTDHGLELRLRGPGSPPSVLLRPLQAEDQVRLDRQRSGPRGFEPAEAAAYADLLERRSGQPALHEWTLTGTLTMSDAQPTLGVRVIHR